MVLIFVRKLSVKKSYTSKGRKEGKDHGKEERKTKDNPDERMG